ncbi:hypothetical protein BVH74_01760 [Halopseudomonas phragmitis]|uniref:DUF4124 domain-containing protein n=3 Tax=Pseudomonadales TaxID=72274 RepID=A0A1V0B1B5_9GAMM|nr:hypothetical protein BVH74_01760 [Halopseudomonas phragmitis]RHW20221.1 DUF4124 domain-containing protein [Pseudomonas jilinensis]
MDTGMRKSLFAIALSLLCSSAMATQMYRWTDDRGQVQFGQQPPADRAYQRIDIKSPPPPGGELRTPAPPVATDPELERQHNEDQQAARARQAQRERECAELRDNLQTLLDNPRLRRTDASGELVRVTEEERQAAIERTRSDLREYCN